MQNLNYINHFKGQEMYNIMVDRPGMRGETHSLEADKIMPFLSREAYKDIGENLGLAGFKEGGQVMIDIAHRQRYLQSNPEKPLDFFAYVEWKYTNPQCITH